MPVPAAASHRRSPRDRAAQATQRRILAVVEKLLAQGGEEAVSIREVCLRAGVTPPTIYHHFGDKRALVDRVVDDCFLEFDRSLARRRRAVDPVEVLRASFDRYVAYGLSHPSHYRLIFQHRRARPTAAGRASYEKLRAAVTRIAEAGRLRTTVDEGAFAFWSTAHGIASLLINGFQQPGDVVALVRDALIDRLTLPAAGRGLKLQPRSSEVQHGARK
jgi:AcrR family transcriptional regulator